MVYNTGANAIDCLLGNMQPFTNVSDHTHIVFTGAQDLKQLEKAKSELDAAMSAYQALHIYNKDCDPKKANERKDAAALLNAAQTADKAAQDSLKAGIDFNSSTLGAPATIVYAVYSINEGIVKGLVNTEPDVSALAGNLKGVIPDSADNLAGIKQAQSATNQSDAATSNAQSKQTSDAQVAAKAGASSHAAAAKAESLGATADNLTSNANTLTANSFAASPEAAKTELQAQAKDLNSQATDAD